MLHDLSFVVVGATTCFKNSLFFGKRRHHSSIDRASIFSLHILPAMAPLIVLLNLEVWLPGRQLNRLKVLYARFFADGEIAFFVAHSSLISFFGGLLTLDIVN